MMSFMTPSMHARADIVHVRADMGSCEQAVIGLESQAVSARVTTHFFTIFIKTCNNCVINFESSFSRARE